MKRIILFLITFHFCCFTTYAQFKPEKGNISTELQFAPFSDNIFSSMGLRGRYFLNEKMAIRLTLNIGLDNENTEYPFSTIDLYNTLKGKATINSSLFNYAIAPGFEWHFAGFERLDIYMGGEILFGGRISNSKYEENLTVTDAYGTFLYSYEKKIEADGAIVDGNENNIQSRSGYNLGANILTGIDFYIYKGLYIGAEFGLGFATSWVSDCTITTDLKQTGYAEVHNVTKLDKQSASNKFGFNCEPKIRFGWKF